MKLTGIVWLSDDDMEFFRTRDPDNPSVSHDRKIREYAERTGGLTLQYWQLALGRIWERPYMMSTAAVADELGRPVSEMEQIVRETVVACEGSNDGSGGSCRVSDVGHAD